MKYFLPLAFFVALPVCAESVPQVDAGEAFLQTFDADKSGAVSKQEYIAPHVQQFEKQFDYMDKNGDGKVDKEEADAFAKEMQERMEHMQQQGGKKR